MPPNALWTLGLVSAIVYGISIGSFLNVVIYRLPRGQSVSSPTWSYCPNCKHRLGGADLFPLFSFLALGRKCRYCRTPISWRYFGVEMLTGVLFTLVYLHDGLTADAIFHALFVAILIPIFFIDLEQFIIPDELSVLGFGVGVTANIYGILHGKQGMWTRIAGADAHMPGSIASAFACALLFHLISLFGLLYYTSAAKAPGVKIASAMGSFLVGILDDYAYLILKFLGFGLWLPPARRFIAEREALIAEAAEQDEAFAQSESAVSVAGKSREEIAAEIENDEEQTGMGQGDAKLAGMIGANLLLPLSLLSFFLAVLAGTVIGVGMMALKGRAGRTAIPFGPFMVIGALVALLIGPTLLHWYLSYAFPATAPAR